MLLDQPGDEFGLLWRQPEARAELARHLSAGGRVILGPALGDVVQQHGDVERLALLDPRHQLGDQRMRLLLDAAFDAREHVDGAQQVLVDRIVMIHVELHHRDDLAEIRNEAAEHARLVHAPEDQFRLAARSEDRQEEAVRLLVFT
ncbi:hypothetical protein D9M72_513930 [compost metagenome]